MNRKRLLLTILIALIAVSAIVGGTLAVFTDTEGTRIEFTAGTIAIDVTGDGWVSGVLNPGEYDDWKPGDNGEWPIKITNVGNNEAWIQIWVYESPPWTAGAPAFWDAAEWNIDHPDDWNQWVLEPGEYLDLTLMVELPQDTGNEFQGAEGDLTILVLATQERNKFDEGYSCVALENKDTTSWVPIVTDDLEGVLCYKVEGGELLVDLNAYGLTPDAYYQLDLTGGDTNNTIDPGCQTQDDNLAGISGDPYTSGYWNWGSVLEGTCVSDHGGEGVYNYAGVGGDVQADATGAISFGGSLPLPAGTYAGVGAHVKEITGTPPGTAWTGVLSEMDYLSFSIP
jgi:predicted ribosomally synthesized peptide with SipW-like signal peptide